MARAKELVVKVIPSKIANEFVKKTHYSGKVVNNSKLHFGVFLNGVLHGVMSYGSPMDKSKVIGLVDTGLTYNQAWNSMLELNRMAFDDVLPKNSESRALAISFRLLKKNAPHIKWILSFSDGTASGDGTIYRASGFYLTSIKPNSTIIEMPDGDRYAKISIQKDHSLRTDLAKKYGAKYWSGSSVKGLEEIGAKTASGFQLRYIKLLDPTAKLKCETIDYCKIDEVGAGMLRGKKITRAERQGK